MTADTHKPMSRGLTALLDSDFTARLDALDILSRKVLQGKLQGERRAKRRGQGVEFADHEPYVAGDDLRFIDWNVYGRLDQLFLKLFIEDQDLTVNLFIDASASMTAGTPPKEQAVKRLTAALAYVGLVNNNRVTLSGFAAGLVAQLAHMRGRNYVGRMADFLLTMPCAGATRFDDACRQWSAAASGSGVLILLSDFLFKEGYEGGLRRLLGRRNDVYVIQMLSPQELEPDLAGDLKLIDIEDGDEAEVTVGAAVLQHYKRTLTAYCNELGAFCTRRGATYILANSAQPVEPLVLNYLRRRGLLK